MLSVFRLTFWAEKGGPAGLNQALDGAAAVMTGFTHPAIDHEFYLKEARFAMAV
jgi:hypothetical protein